MFIIALQ